MPEFSVHVWDNTGVPVYEVTIENLSASTALNAAIQIFRLHLELGDYFVDPTPLVVEDETTTVFRAESADKRKAIITIKHLPNRQSQ